MSMRHRWLALGVAAALLGAAGAPPPAAAQGTVRSQVNTSTDAIQREQRSAVAGQRPEDAVTYVSGGVGNDSVAAMRAIKDRYNLRMLFAVQGSGEYLANVRVTLLDAHGAVVFDAVSEGPFFFAKLPPGGYEIVVDNAGRTLRKQIEIAASAPVLQAFYWRPNG